MAGNGEGDWCIGGDMAENGMGDWCIMGDTAENGMGDWCIMGDMAENGMGDWCIMGDMSGNGECTSVFMVIWQKMVFMVIHFQEMALVYMDDMAGNVNSVLCCG